MKQQEKERNETKRNEKMLQKTKRQKKRARSCPSAPHLLSILRNASSMNTLESAPDHSGSLSGKSWPISGSPRAPENKKNVSTRRGAARATLRLSAALFFFRRSALDKTARVGGLTRPLQTDTYLRPDRNLTGYSVAGQRKARAPPRVQQFQREAK